MYLKKMLLKPLLVTILLFAIAACKQDDATSYNPTFSTQEILSGNDYIIGIHPLHNPERLHSIFSPLAEYLSQKIPNARFKIEASRNYAEFDRKLYAGEFAIALPNPYQTVNSLKHGYKVFGKMGDDENFRGIILVRKDSGIKEVADLKGKAVSFPAPTALAATMMPQYYLQTNGLNIKQDIEIRYVGSQESSIMDVYLGNVAAAATWPPPWRLLSKERPELAAELYPIWQTASLPNNALVARGDVAPEVIAKVGKELFTLHENPQGRGILAAMGLSQFEEAEDKDYDPVLVFLEKYADALKGLDDNG